MAGREMAINDSLFFNDKRRGSSGTMQEGKKQIGAAGFKNIQIKQSVAESPSERMKRIDTINNYSNDMKRNNDLISS